MTTDDSLPALVAASIRGDREAFGALYRRFGRAVHGVLISKLAREDAEDLLQDVFLHAFAHLKEIRQPEAFGGWICAIARRRATDFYRQRRPIEPITDNAAATDRPDVTAEASRALAAIQTLPEAYRETLVLRLVEGLSGPEIARLTGLTPDSVRVNLHRGFRLLRERLGIQVGVAP
jgi:RNA polymerase sigma-70 factor, ECF subfamily